MGLKIFFHSSLLVICAISFRYPAHAQKIDEHEFEFDYIRQPLRPLPEGITNYSSNVVQAFAADVLELQKMNSADYESRMKDYEKKLAAAEKKQDSLNAAYELAKENAIARYDSAMAVYKEKSNLDKFVENKILKDTERPRLILPDRHFVRFPVKPEKPGEDYQKIFNEEILANSYLSLDGYKRSDANAVQITVIMYGFEFLDPVLRSKPSTYYNSETKTSTEVISYWYEVAYRHPMSLQVVLPDGTEILNTTFGEMTRYTMYKTPKTNGHQGIIDTKGLKGSFQDKIVEENMKFIRNYLNENFGYSKLKRKAVIYNVLNKNGQYNDHQAAFENIMTGYSNLVLNKDKAFERISAAAALWQKEADACEPFNKKARVDAGIGIATRFNLCEAYTWLGDYDKAEEQLSKILTLSPSRKDEKKVEEMREFVYKQRGG